MTHLKTLFLLLLYCATLTAQELQYHHPKKELTAGATHYLFGDQVKFRSLPNLNSEVLELLKIGTPIQILEKSEETLNYKGLTSHFYKVQYKNQVGYILGGLLSLEKKETDTTLYLFTYQRTDDQDHLIIRQVDKTTATYTEMSTPLNTSDIYIEWTKNKGLVGIDHILFINYLASACGVDGGGIYYFQFNNKLKKVFEFSQISDAGVYWFSEQLTFPEEENGVSGKIVYQKEVGTYKDETGNWTEVTTTSRELEWKDGQIVPDVKAKE